MPGSDVDRSVRTAPDPDGTEGTAMLAAAIPDERAARDPAGAAIADERQELDNARFAQTVAAANGVARTTMRERGLPSRGLTSSVLM